MFARHLALAGATLFIIGAAEGPDQAALLFGARESVEGISLSPDGTKIAYLAPAGRGQGSTLYTVSLKGGDPVPAVTVDGRTQRLSDCGWVSESRLVCQLFAIIQQDINLLPVNRLIGLDADGKNVKMLSERENIYQQRMSIYGGHVLDWLPDETNAILVGRDYVPETRQKTRIEQKLDGYGVARINTLDGRDTVVEPPKRIANEFISDGHGVVRIMATQPPAGASGMTGATVNYFYRTWNSREWLPFSTYDTQAKTGLNPYAIDPALNVVYASKRVGGRRAFVRVGLDGSMKEEPVFSHPVVDADEIVSLGRARRPVGVSFVTDRRETVYFDPSLKALSNSLSKALPGLPLVRFAGASKDEQKMLIWAGSDTDPGRYYVFDRATKKLDEIMLVRPQLENRPLAAVKAVSYRAADGTMIPAYLSLPPGGSGKGLPAIVLPHGGPSARDEWGFDWLTQFYTARGYAVLQPQFRGSSGYGDAWFQDQGFKKWAVAVGDVNDAGRWLVAQGIADASKLAIVGWSYGGYAALQSNVLDPDLFKAVVAIAPVTDLNLLGEQYRGWSNFALTRDFIGEGSHRREGSPAQNAARFKAPVLMFHGDLDRNVKVVESRYMDEQLAKAGKKHSLIVYPGLDHYLEDSVARIDMLTKSDAFLRASMGIKAP